MKKESVIKLSTAHLRITYLGTAHMRISDYIILIQKSLRDQISYDVAHSQLLVMLFFKKPFPCLQKNCK
uniref:Uncharacterized protein n=1 Tax=Romanomermis culicivorax TaxID=13658 RepID=A0A915IZJ1_ROMCU